MLTTRATPTAAGLRSGSRGMKRVAAVACFERLAAAFHDRDDALDYLGIVDAPGRLQASPACARRLDDHDLFRVAADDDVRVVRRDDDLAALLQVRQDLRERSA